jgi:hypothetical protein
MLKKLLIAKYESLSAFLGIGEALNTADAAHVSGSVHFNEH